MATKRMLAGIRFEIQNVTAARRAECSVCENMILRRRLHVKRGSGQWAKTEILCIKCGSDLLEATIAKLERAFVLLKTGKGSINA